MKRQPGEEKEFRLKALLMNLFFSLSFLSEFTDGIRLTELRVPNHTVKDSTVQLECHYDLNNDGLYSVKWYKDGNEFFRYMPRDHPPVLVFPLSGITVDVRTKFCLSWFIFIHFIHYLFPDTQFHRHTCCIAIDKLIINRTLQVWSDRRGTIRNSIRSQWYGCCWWVNRNCITYVGWPMLAMNSIKQPAGLWNGVMSLGNPHFVIGSGCN